MTEQNHEFKELMKIYDDGPGQLDALLEGLSESHLDLARAEGKWTIRQIVHHIVDAEDLWESAIKAALGNTGCTFDFSWYILDNKCAVPLDYAIRPIDTGVELFKAVRRHLYELITHLPDSLEKNVRITHEDNRMEEKTFSVSKMIHWQNLHLDIHLKQIKETREVQGI
jgi:hypothetical protein